MKTECEAKIAPYELELSKAAEKENNSLELFKKLSNTLKDVDLFYSEGKLKKNETLLTQFFRKNLK
jgi:hypothetical protein